MMRRMMALVLPCRRVLEAASTEGIAAQPWWRRPLFAAHLAGCGFCARFARQMELIRRALTEELGRPKNEDCGALQERILRRILPKP